MTSPQVSVLLPVRDGERTVKQAVQSLTSQTLSEIEIVVVDDGSTDGTGRVLERLARGDQRIVLLRQRAAGIVAALQRAARAARGSLLARMDADDECHPERLARQFGWLHRRDDLVAVGCLVESFGDGRGVTDGWRRYEAWLNNRRTAEQIARDLLVESPLAHPSVMMRREAFEAVGGYRDFDGPEDYDLWLRLALAGGAFAKVPRVLLRWRDRPDRLTRSDPRYRPEAFMRLKVDYLLDGPLRKRGSRPLLVWGAGRYGGRLGKLLVASGVQIDAFVDIDPARIGSVRHGIPIVPPAEIDRFHRPMVFPAVALPQARSIIRARLTRRGLVERQDYWVCG